MIVLSIIHLPDMSTLLKDGVLRATKIKPLFFDIIQEIHIFHIWLQTRIETPIFLVLHFCILPTIQVNQKLQNEL